MLNNVPLVPPEVERAFTHARVRLEGISFRPQWYPSLPSTMDTAADAADAGVPEGFVVVVDEQTEGRGRRGRTWSSPPGAGLYASFVLRPPVDVPRRVLSLITIATGVAVRSAVTQACGFAPDLKWPNDVIVGRRKLAGILAEGAAIGSPQQAIVVGVGLNVLRTSHPGEIAKRATSLEDELGRLVERDVLLEEVLVAVLATYRRLCSGDADGILREWRTASPSASGTPVEWNADSGPCRGTTAGIDDDGALLVQTPSGQTRIISGELRWTLPCR
jgi:BirA family transcriptional regulator, biotin operon repressor / biotin---[acetyl-CoA-carboxylase] ligase